MTRETKPEITWIGKEQRQRPEPSALDEGLIQAVPRPPAGERERLLRQSHVLRGQPARLEGLGAGVHGEDQVRLHRPSVEHQFGLRALRRWDRAFAVAVEMRDRLELLRKLVRDDESIWISIDCNEISYLWYKLQNASNLSTEHRLEDFLVRGQIDFDDISYNHHAELLYKQAGQLATHLQSYLADDEEVFNVLVAYDRQLVNTIYAQMQKHYFETATSHKVTVTKGFRSLHSTSVLTAADESLCHYRAQVLDQKHARGMLFSGFNKRLYLSQKFDTDRRFSVLIENDGVVLKWFKPGRNVFSISYLTGIEEGDYEPDLVVETAKVKYLCEPKGKDSMADPVVIPKSKATAERRRHATEVSDKPWVYLLIPQDAVDESKTLAGLAAPYAYRSKARK